jgi:hypothetical protein
MTICKDDIINELVEYELEHLTVTEMLNMVGTFLAVGYGELEEEDLRRRYADLGASDHAIH